MRSVSHVIAGYLANTPEGKPFVKRTVKNIILRGDDATEILSFYLSTFGKPIPNSLRKALKEVFPTFDEYTLAKYKGEGKSVKMRDILCLCRPKPTNDEQSKLWKELLEGTIKPAYTWEVELSAKGNNKKTWEELIKSGKVGYMALLRNLRNIMLAKPDNMYDVFDKIADPVAVRKSKQLPFRFLSAYREIDGLSVGDIGLFEQKDALDALERAADAAVWNLPRIPGKTIIAIDTSGSMSQPVSSKSKVRCCDISTMLGLIANRICEKSAVFTFDDSLKLVNVPDSKGSLLSATIANSTSGGGTNMYLPFQYILNHKTNADRIIVLSDNECNYWMNRNGTRYSWYYNRPNDDTVQKVVDRYRREVNPNFWVHAVDLAGYGTQQFIGEKTNIVAGWSEKLFEFILMAEQGEGSLIKRIKNYKVFGEEMTA